MTEPWKAAPAAMQKAAALRLTTVGMTFVQFAEWDEAQRLISRKLRIERPKAKPRMLIGMSERRRLAIMRAALPPDIADGIIGADEVAPPTDITVIEALACAHVALRLPMPIAADDVDAFATWCAERFVQVDEVARCLGVRTDWITDRIRGFDVRGGKREARTPDAGLIRAMDWLRCCGPFNPWTDAP